MKSVEIDVKERWLRRTCVIEGPERERSENILMRR